jgi:GNAT superfamily N-acetyltransferase
MPIRTAESGDVLKVVELCRHFHAESRYSIFNFEPDWLTGMFNRCARAPRHEVLFLVAQRGADFYGFLLAHMGSTIFSARKAAILDLLYVRADRRGGVTGPAMLRRFVTWAAPLSPVLMDFTITTGIDEAGTRRLARRFGFSEAGTVFRWQPD